MTDGELIALADHIDEIDLATLLGQGRYIWFRPADNTFHATTERDGGAELRYLFDASPGWVDQWGGNLTTATDSLIDPLINEMDRPVEGSE